jgi:hypothetical protein
MRLRFAPKGNLGSPTPRGIWRGLSGGGNLAEHLGGHSRIAHSSKAPRPALSGSKMERAPANRGSLYSGSMSRILSGAIIYLRGPRPPGPRSPRSCGLPGSHRAGSTILLGLAPGGVYPAAASPRRWCALTAPFHLCLYATHVWPRHRLCRFCGTFPRVSPGGSYPPPCPVVSGLSSRGFDTSRDRVTRSKEDRPPDADLLAESGTAIRAAGHREGALVADRALGRALGAEARPAGDQDVLQARAPAAPAAGSAASGGRGRPAKAATAAGGAGARVWADSGDRRSHVRPF